MNTWKDPYQELEIYLEKAQEDIGKAFDDLLQYEKDSLKLLSNKEDKCSKHFLKFHRPCSTQQPLSSSKYELFSDNRKENSNSLSETQVRKFSALQVSSASNDREKDFSNIRGTNIRIESKALDSNPCDCEVYAREQNWDENCEQLIFLKACSVCSSTVVEKSPFPCPPRNGDVNLLSIWADNLVHAIDKGLENSLGHTSPLSECGHLWKAQNDTNEISNESKIDSLDIQKRRVIDFDTFYQHNSKHDSIKRMSPSPDSGICQVSSDNLDANPDDYDIFPNSECDDAIWQHMQFNSLLKDPNLDGIQYATLPPVEFEDSIVGISFSSNIENGDESVTSLNKLQASNRVNDSFFQIADNDNVLIFEDILGMDDSGKHTYAESKATSNIVEAAALYPVVTTTSSINGYSSKFTNHLNRLDDTLPSLQPLFKSSRSNIGYETNTQTSPNVVYHEGESCCYSSSLPKGNCFAVSLSDTLQRSFSYSSVSSISQVSVKELAEFMGKVETSTYLPPPLVEDWNKLKTNGNFKDTFSCDAVTQTTPIMPLSRSSSFTWVTECDCSEWESSNGPSVSEDSSIEISNSDRSKNTFWSPCKSSSSSLSTDECGYEVSQNSGCSSLYLSACSDGGSSIASESCFQDTFRTEDFSAPKQFSCSTCNLETTEKANILTSRSLVNVTQQILVKGSLSLKETASHSTPNRVQEASYIHSTLNNSEIRDHSASPTPLQHIEGNVLRVHELSVKSSSAPILRDKKRFLIQNNSNTVFLSKETSETAIKDSRRGEFDCLQRAHSAKELCELQAIEACSWLRAAGFPQYAQMYEEANQFPIDICTVQKDHAFLHPDLIESLFRRLNTLNRCARMKLTDAARIANNADENAEEEDEEECALSENWQFERESRRWSRVAPDTPVSNECCGAEAASPKPHKTTTLAKKYFTSEEAYCSSYDSVFLEEHFFSPDNFRRSSGRHDEKNLPIVTFREIRDNSPSSGSGGTPGCVFDDKNFEGNKKNLHRSGSDRIKQGAKALLRRMESLKSKRKKKKDHALEYSVTGNSGTDGSSCSSLTPSPLLARAYTSVRPIQDNSDCSQESTPLMKYRKEGFYTTYKDEVEIDTHSDSECSPFMSDWGNFGDDELMKYYMAQNTLTVPKSAVSIKSSNTCAKSRRYKSNLKDFCGVSASLSPSRHLLPYNSRANRHEEEDDYKRSSQYDNLPAPLAVFNAAYVDCFETDFQKAGTSYSSSLIQVDIEHLDEDIIIINNDRRDSGVGASLTRGSPCYSPWHCFLDQQVSAKSSPPIFPITELTAPQLLLLRKLALLKLTSLMEKYSPSSRTGWTWTIPKFIRRIRTPDYKDKFVFGVPVAVVLQRTGQPMPSSIHAAMEHLRRNALGAVGIFRKSGVRSRIQRLRNRIENSQSVTKFDDQQSYDVADVIKQYFRELPESMLTSKLSETFITVFQYIPEELRLEAIRAAIVLMPDENREALQVVLAFLQEVSDHAVENQMNATNLAVCFAPSLFHLTIPRSSSASPRRKKTIGNPDVKQLNENRAAYECLATMIMNYELLCSVSENVVLQSRLYHMENCEPATLDEVSQLVCSNNTGWKMYIEGCVQSLLKEAKDKYKGWISFSQTDNVDITYKKVDDDHPLRLWKVSTEIEAPPTEVLNCILRERHLWDASFIKWRVVKALTRDTEIFHFVTSCLPPHPNCDFCILRSWRTELPKAACMLIEVSIDHTEVQCSVDGVRAIILASRYLIEPCGSGKSRITHVSRVDLRGRSPEWYNRAYGNISALDIIKLRNSFSHIRTGGPETKV